ncbi:MULTISPECIES: radical SAM protein [Actinosynnema]|uniref:radical SAM protein n=1 Tax=Actinosynnema TaxID=40566 RepID=UPI0020A4F2D2|nr:radical SAM protein [Actinosynnema pretiosum]
MCTLRCLHCYSSSGPDVAESLPIGVLGPAVREAAALGYDVLSVSGGEPLLYPELRALVRAARDAGMRTTVTTNGLSLTPRRIALLREVDLVAVSVDGVQPDHDRLRGEPGSHDRAMTGVRRLTEAGVPVGVVTTLTKNGATRLGEVADQVAAAGALLLQVRPLEAEGAARRLSAERPGPVELAYAAVELGRVAAEHGLAVQLDAVPRTSLLRDRASFTAEGATGDLGAWLTPLVVEANGAVVPSVHGFDRRYALGSLLDRPLADLAASWDPAPYRDLCARTWEQLTGGRTGPLITWYGHLLRASRARVGCP